MRLLLVLGLLLPFSASAAETLRVMSFNVRYPNPKDGADVWEARRDLLVKVIRDSAPDLIGTQELFKTQGDYIVSRLPEYEWFGLSRRGNHEDEHMGVFFRKDRWKLIESTNFWLSETGQPNSLSWGMSLPRMVTAGVFEDRESGRRIWLLNTHFPHRGAEDAKARLECARLIVRKIGEKSGVERVILTGDFNTGVDTEPYRLLTSELKDTRAGQTDPGGDTGTFHGFSGKPGTERIDWILYRGALQPVSFETIKTSQEGRYPSDHFPVLAVFELR